MQRLSDKIIIVTGGSGLIGQAILAKVREEGGIAINAEIDVVSDLDNGIVNCDVTSEVSIKNAIGAIQEKYRRIDGWVNNAYPRTHDWGNKFEHIPAASWKQNVDSQLNSVFLCCQQVLELMKKQENGSVVNISSIYGMVGPDFSIYEGTDMTMPAAYSAIKGGIVNLSRYLASYYGHSNVRVNCVSPGGIYNAQDTEFVAKYAKKVPLKRMGQPSDISPAVCFLLSEQASYITGHNLMVDGGWTAI